MDQNFSGRVIYLSNEAHHFPRIQKVEEGVVLQQKRVLVDDLLDSMLSMMEPAMQMKYLLDSPDFFNEVLLPVMDNLNDQQKPSIYSYLYLYLSHRIKDNVEGKDTVKELLDTFLSYFKEQNLNTKEVVKLFKILAKHIRSEKNEQLVAELYLHLLTGVDLAGKASNELIEKTLNEIMRVRDPLKEEFLSKLIKKYEGQHVVCTSPILPKGTLLYQEDNKGNYIIAIEVEPQQRDVLFYQTTFENVGQPRLIVRP